MQVSGGPHLGRCYQVLPGPLRYLSTRTEYGKGLTGKSAARWRRVQAGAGGGCPDSGLGGAGHGWALDAAVKPLIALARRDRDGRDVARPEGGAIMSKKGADRNNDYRSISIRHQIRLFISGIGRWAHTRDALHRNRRQCSYRGGSIWWYLVASRRRQSAPVLVRGPRRNPPRSHSTTAAPLQTIGEPEPCRAMQSHGIHSQSPIHWLGGDQRGSGEAQTWPDKPARPRETAPWPAPLLASCWRVCRQLRLSRCSLCRCGLCSLCGLCRLRCAEVRYSCPANQASRACPCDEVSAPEVRLRRLVGLGRELGHGGDGVVRPQ